MGEVLPIANTYSAHAPRYHALGFIPIPAKPDDKLPAVKWKELQPGMSRSELDELMSSHGGASCMGTVIPIMSPFCVLDFDDGAFKALCDNFPYQLPSNTPVARSGGVSESTGARDRYHVYYKWGRHRGIAKSIKEGELFSGIKVALKADKSFAVLPPSTHKSGNRYEWLPGQAPWEVDMQEIPELIVQAVLNHRGMDFDKYKPAKHDYKTIRELAQMRAGSGRDPYLISDLGWARNQEALGFDRTSPDISLLRKRAMYVNDLFGEPLPDAEVEKIVESSFKMWEAAAAAMDSGAASTKNGKAYEIHEIGVTERFADEVAPRLRYLTDRKTWCSYTGSFWEVQDKGYSGCAQKEVTRIARELPDEASAIQDESERMAMKKRLVKLRDSILGSVNKAKAIASYCEGSVPDRMGSFNTDKRLLNFANGTLSLTDYTLKPHDPLDMLTKSSGVAYDPSATCPKWEAFVLESLEGDPERVRYLQKALGYALTGDCARHMFFIMHGEGNNGKSVMMQTISRILNIGESGYVYPAKINSFLATRNSEDKIGNDVLDMAGHRLIYAEEPRRGVTFNDGLIKDLAAGGPQTGRRLHENMQNFSFIGKLFFLCNHLPNLSDTGRGLQRRVAVIPFGRGVANEKVDINLPDKLFTEASGILNWLLDGHKALLAEGDRSLLVATCPAVDEATQKYLASNNKIGQFIEDWCEVGTGYRERTALIRTGYEAWLDEYGYDKLASTQGIVNEGLATLGFGEPKKSHGNSVFVGLRLKESKLRQVESVYERRTGCKMDHDRTEY